MVEARSIGGRASVALQLSLAGIALVIGAAAPPVHGRLLLLPLSSQGIDDRRLAETGLTRIGAGPLAGSLVVEGPGMGLAATFLDEGVLMISAPASLCTAFGEG